MSARDDLARLIFITDNKGAKDPAAEWEEAVRRDGPDSLTHYAYAIADGLLAAGVTMPEQPVTNEHQHCTAEDCYTMSHTAEWCGREQPRRCGCAYCYPEEAAL